MKLFLSNEQVTCSCFPHHTFLILHFAYSISSGGKAIEISGEHLDASLLHYDSCKGLESEEDESTEAWNIEPTGLGATRPGSGETSRAPGPDPEPLLGDPDAPPAHDRWRQVRGSARAASSALARARSADRALSCAHRAEPPPCC